MASTSTTIHWHGIDLKNATMMDGVMGVSQCPIPPGDSYTYEFQIIDQRGTFWYHAHASTQYTDGLYGPIVLHDPEEMVPSGIDDEKIIFLGDLYHAYSSILLESYLGPGSRWSPDVSGVEPLPDNFIINGQNTYDCAVKSTTWPSDDESDASSCTGGSVYNTTIEPGQTVRLRLINHSSFMAYWFSVDNHNLTIVELDGVEIEPIEGQRGVYMNIGQRASVLLTANQPQGTYHIRATLPQSCFVPYALPYMSAPLNATKYQSTALLIYNHSPVPLGVPGNVTNPYGAFTNPYAHSHSQSPPPWSWEGCDDMPFSLPLPKRPKPAIVPSPRNSHILDFQFQQAGAVNRVFINRTSYRPLVGDAQLWQALDNVRLFSDPPEGDEQEGGGSYHSWNFTSLSQQVLLVPDAGKGAQVVINSLDNMEHPFHLHGHSFQIVAWGPGRYDGSLPPSPAPSLSPPPPSFDINATTSSPSPETTMTTLSPSKTTWSLANPMRRDTLTVPALSHVVIRFEADNPGIWALHCHVAWHVEDGMLVTFIERPEDIASTIDDNANRASQRFCARRTITP